MKDLGKIGLILALRSDRPNGDFVVLDRVNAYSEWGLRQSIEERMAEHRKLTGPISGKPMYLHVWYIDVDLPHG